MLIKQKIQRSLLLFFCFTFLIVFVTIVSAENIDEMNKRIEQKKTEIERLIEKLGTYQNKIKEANKEAKNLKNELKILDNEIEKNELDIDITEKQIQKTNLEIQRITFILDQKEKEIERQKKRIAEFLRIMYQQDQISYIEILLMNRSFSDFFDQYEYLQNVQNKIYLALEDLKNLKKDLEIQKSTLDDKRKREVELKQTLEIQKGELLAVSNEKETILSETQRSEKKFQSYVQELKRQQQEINGEIVSLEKQVRAELEKRKKEEKFKELGPVRLQWPVSSRDITAYFHDPEYPYRYIFEHPAVDIRTPQGTLVRASEAGYVAKIKDGGLRGYSYIMILHSEGITTVYGHVSSLLAKANEYVKKGDIIANSGGQPGTRGAGPMTTGPHLHFEVRKNGVPVNPVDYLP